MTSPAPVHPAEASFVYAKTCDDLLKFADVYREEIQAIADWTLSTRQKPPDPSTDDAQAEREYERQLFREVSDKQVDLSALCLSGGGIRSASFALGVMQGLARFGLLGNFDYLSSVSGGGYIASWLTLWRHRAPDAEILKALNQSIRLGFEAPQITGIRADSNYLTPRLGLLSGDTWTLITLYCRNLLLNWMLFVPFFMGCLMVPRLWNTVVLYIYAASHNPHVTLDMRAFPDLCECGAVSLFVGLSFGVYGRFRRQRKWLTNARFKLLVLLPLVISGLSFTLAAVVADAGVDGVYRSTIQLLPGFLEVPVPADISKLLADHSWIVGALPGAAIYFLAWALGRTLSKAYADQTGERVEPVDVLYWTVSGAVVGTLVYFGMNAITQHARNSDFLTATSVLGLSGFVLAYLAGELLYVGLSSFSAKGDMDREWLARSSGWLSATAIGVTIFCAVSISAPVIMHDAADRIVAFTAASLSGATTLVLGSSGKTAATEALQALKTVPLMRIASGAAVLFALLIASLLALFDEYLVAIFNNGTSTSHAVLVPFLASLALFVLAFALSIVVNVNRFSLHALYCNRIVRAFLGSARGAGRTPDPFTGFDPNDNPRLADTNPLEQKSSLFHVINTALNTVASRNTAWQQRKAESFTMSRLACGNPYVGYRRTRYYGDKAPGLSLGTAVAISGAAVSPNQGYNSSPLIGFLLMLFNVRLGWWLGNPKRASFAKAGPTFSLAPALRELVGDTTDEAEWVYLSDGGHFENLGLYEMVRRRCRLIVVSDAGCDPSCSFEDLGNAVRKIYIDFGISINFEKLDIKARQNPPTPGMRFAIGSITYPESPRPGWLLYLKPTYFGSTERADVRSYASGSSSFPHESTTDQWFSESQLESYRALGAGITEFICSGGKQVPPGSQPTEIDFVALKILAAQLMHQESSTVQAAIRN